MSPPLLRALSLRCLVRSRVRSRSCVSTGMMSDNFSRILSDSLLEEKHVYLDS